MFGVMSLLLVVALGLHLNPSEQDQKLNIQTRVFRLVFCISISIFIPALIQYTFSDVSQYDIIIFNPVIMYIVGIIFSIGLEFHVYGKLS
jgi:hypothetical protein